MAPVIKKANGRLQVDNSRHHYAVLASYQLTRTWDWRHPLAGTITAADGPMVICIDVRKLHPERVSRSAEFWQGAIMNGQDRNAIIATGDDEAALSARDESGDGVPLHVAGRVNIYGRQEAVAEWLVYQVTQTISSDPANLIIIDGAGDLVPRLKRKTAVTRLLGEGLAYVDIDDASQVNGFNPLAAVPGETEEQTLLRWQRWFQGMNVQAQGLQLLGYAQKDGVGDIPSLRRWLKKFERQGGGTAVAGQSVLASVTQAVSSLNIALNRVIANPSLREWLEWPTNRFDSLPDSALFFACKGTEWDRRQLLRAVLLAALSQNDVRLIIHGFLWREMDADPLIRRLGRRGQLIIGNGHYCRRASSF